MSTRGGYVLKFISGKYQGGEFPLEMDSEIVIGRSSDLDMVLVEDMVSRRHARITSYGGELSIEDFGSTNGSFVNGERITKARLKEGDRILIGTNIIKLVHRDNLEKEASPSLGHGGDMNPLNQSGDMSGSIPPHSHTTMMKPGATIATGQSIISGLIEEVPLPDLLQLFSASKRSGNLVIVSDDEGKIFLREGRVIFATINEDHTIDPYKAFYRVLSWKKGHFSLEPSGDESFEDEINESIEALMMEGMRQFDEIHNLGEDVPPQDSMLVLQAPLTAPLRDLQPEHLDALQLAFNYSRVSMVLNKSQMTDLETMRNVLYLLRNDYLRVV